MQSYANHFYTVHWNKFMLRVVWNYMGGISKRSTLHIIGPSEVHLPSIGDGQNTCRPEFPNGCTTLWRCRQNVVAVFPFSFTSHSSHHWHKPPLNIPPTHHLQEGAAGFNPLAKFYFEGLIHTFFTISFILKFKGVVTLTRYEINWPNCLKNW